MRLTGNAFARQSAPIPNLKIGIASALALKQFLASDPLGVVLIANLEPACVIRQVWIGLALCHDAFEIVLACQPEQFLAISVEVIAIEETFTLLGRDRMKPELAVYQRQIPKVFAILESASFLLIVRPSVLVPQDVEGIKHRLGMPEQEITELRLAISFEADDLAIENAAATL